MFFSVLFSVSLAATCCRASVGGGLQKSVPIETVYPRFHGGRSGIMVHRDSFRPVRGYAVDPFKRPNTRRNHFKRRRNGSKIVFLVMHFTADLNLENTVKHFTGNTTHRQTSSHYVIAKPTEASKNEQLLRVVPENCISYHAGISKWGNYKNLNPISIGIEIVNSGFSKNSWESFYPAQIRIVGLILARMVDEYNVLPNNVVGHADIAPHRKSDPGVMFPWAKLYTDYGVGAWLDVDETVEKVIVTRYKPKTRCPRKPNKQLFLKYLRAYGYNVTDETKSIMAFKAHYTANQKPKMYNDDVTRLEMYWIWALVAKYARGRI